MAVAQELEKLDEDANVYKLIGPVLIKQDRSPFFELAPLQLVFAFPRFFSVFLTQLESCSSHHRERLDKMVKGMESKQESKHKEITELQKKLQQLSTQQ